LQKRNLPRIWQFKKAKKKVEGRQKLHKGRGCVIFHPFKFRLHWNQVAAFRFYPKAGKLLDHAIQNPSNPLHPNISSLIVQSKALKSYLTSNLIFPSSYRHHHHHSSHDHVTNYPYFLCCKLDLVISYMQHHQLQLLFNVDSTYQLHPSHQVHRSLPYTISPESCITCIPCVILIASVTLSALVNHKSYLHQILLEKWFPCSTWHQSHCQYVQKGWSWSLMQSNEAGIYFSCHDL